MDKTLTEQIKEAKADGWKLCVRCRLNSEGSRVCEYCPVSMRKLMGTAPPEKGNECVS